MKREIAAILQEWTTSRIRRRDEVAVSIYRILRSEGVVPKKRAAHLKERLELFDHVSYSIDKFAATLKKTKDFERAFAAFSDCFNWRESLKTIVYTRHPPVAETDYEEVPTNDELNKLPAHFVNAGQDRLQSDVTVTLMCNRSSFDEDQNPLDAIEAFLVAHDAKIYPPVWVLDFMAEVFQEYWKSAGTKNLEQLFGFRKKQGRGTVFKEEYERFRNEVLAKDVHRLVTFCGFTLDEACHMAKRRLETQGQGYDKIGVRTDLSEGMIGDIYKRHYRKMFKETDRSGHSTKETWIKNGDIDSYLSNFPPDAFPGPYKNK